MQDETHGSLADGNCRQLCVLDSFHRSTEGRVLGPATESEMAQCHLQ